MVQNPNPEELRSLITTDEVIKKLLEILEDFDLETLEGLYNTNEIPVQIAIIRVYLSKGGKQKDLGLQTSANFQPHTYPEMSRDIKDALG